MHTSEGIRPGTAVMFWAALLGAGALGGQSISINPGYTNLGVNQTLQYTATVTGLTNKTVTWLVSGVKGGNSTLGTISQAGLYKAPAAIPTSSTLIEALGSDNKTLGTVYVNIEPAGPPITSISPSPIPTGNFSITVTGTGYKSGAIIQFNGANLLTTFVNSTTLKTSGWASASLASGTFKVENPGTLWGAVYTAAFGTSGPPPPPTISPTTANVLLGATQQFTSSGGTSWTASAGSVSSTGLYTAPAAMPTSPTVTVTVSGAGGSASATVTLQNPNPQTISPASVWLSLGGTQQFTSTGATSWSAKYGTVTTAGFYTAPATLPSSSSDTVTVVGSNGTANATVTLAPPTPVITGVGSNGQLPLGVFSTTITGAGFQPTSVAKLNGTPITTTYAAGSLTVTGFSASSGPASMTVSTGSLTSAPYPVQIGIANALVSAAAARRFLEQAAFGPSPSDAAGVQTLGFQGWLNQQFAMAPVSNYSSITGSQGGMPQLFLTNAVMNPDQLRQRVAFALSQVFVTSIQKLIWNDNMVLYQNMLLNDTFTNYRQIMADVTLSPAMGQYLDMANNAMGNPATGTLANENFAREMMQLFTIGTNMLNQDGSLQLDSNNLPIPTYYQPTIGQFARVYTGWTYAPAPGNPVQWNAYISSYGPMVPYAAEHDSGSKTLLNGYVAQAGVTPQQDLNNALDNIFNHPNVGPFVARLLIQHLVKSNPSPAYIYRVAGVFNNNGQGVRGDMKAVISAILLDPEARANDAGGSDQLTDGHLQEPVLYVAGIFRAFGGTMTTQNYFSWDLVNLDQDIFDSPSVFNYYSETYQAPGTSLMGGEFQIHTPAAAIWRANMVAGLFGSWSNPVLNYGPGTNVDVTAFVPLAAMPATLVNALDLTLTHGTMPGTMKTEIVNAVAADTDGSVHQVETACYLILTSSYYSVWH